MIVLDLSDPASTERLGAAVAATARAGDVLLLSGELGVGKTTLTRGLVRALGGGEVVTSPTFALVQTYATTPVVAHVDCWRLDDPAEVADLGLEELLDDGAVVVAEWGERAAPFFGAEALCVTLAYAGAHRTARIDGSGSRGAEWLEQLSVVEAVT